MAVSQLSVPRQRAHHRWGVGPSRNSSTRLLAALLFAAFLLLALSAFCVYNVPSGALAAGGGRRSGRGAARGGGQALLLYVPLFSGQDGDGGLATFVAGLTTHTPWMTPQPLLPVDVLLVASSPKGDISSSHTLGEHALRGAFAAAFPASTLFIHRLTAQQAVQYDRSRSSAGWTAGPNAVFYAVMAAGGAVYEQRTKQYSHVLQLETDCVLLRSGWLAALVAPVLDARRRHPHNQPAFLLSGALLGPGQCVYDDVAHSCGDVAAQADYVQRHINGNALYQLSPQLQAVFNHSLDVYPTWPFDLATWLSARDLSLTHLMVASPHAVNIASRIAPGTLHDPAQLVRGTRLHAGELVFAHVPLRMRLGALDAALAALVRSVPVTLTFVSASHLEYAAQWVASVAAAGVRNVLVVAFDEQSAGAVSAMAPPHFTVLVNHTTARGSTAFKSDAFLAAVNARHGVIVDLLAAGFSLFAVDVDCHVTGSYSAHLATLAPDTVFFASDAAAGVGYHHYGEPRPRYFLNAGLFYVPPGAIAPALALFKVLQATTGATGRADQDVLNDMVVCTALATCAYPATGTKLGLLDPVRFQNGANYFSKQWPSYAALTGALVVHNNWAEGVYAKRFRAQAAGLWRTTTQHLPVCASVAVLDTHLQLGGAAQSTGSVVATYLQFFAHVKQGGFVCAVVPGFAAPGNRTLPFDVLFDAAAVRNFTAAELYPALGHLQAGAAPVHWPGGQVEEAVLPDDLMLSPALMTTFHWLDDMIGSPRTCVDDLGRTVEQVAVAALQTDSLAAVLSAAAAARDLAHNRVFLAGAWRVAHPHIDALAPDVAVSASPRFFPPHERFSFGLGFVHGTTGDDPLFDALDLLLCRASQKAVRLEPGSVVAAAVAHGEQLLRAVAAHIPPAVLAEDLAVLGAMPLAQLQAALSQRLLFSLEPVANNGLSNVIGAAQTLAFLATTHALRGVASSAAGQLAFIMPPFQGQHLRPGCAPWGDIVNATAFYAALPHALPPSTLPLLHPRAALDGVLHGAQMAAAVGGATAADALLDGYPSVVTALVTAAAGRTYTRLFVSHDRAEALQLGGHVAAQPSHEYLGCTDTELRTAVAHVDPSSDVALPTVFRSYAFMLNDTRHVMFGAQWRAAFRANAAVEAKARGILEALPRPFACIHLRLKEEYLRAHGGAVHGNASVVLASFKAYLSAQRARKVTTFYAATDTNAAAALAPLVPPGAVLFTCADFGCAAEQAGEESGVGFVDRSVCAAADFFVGNIYSSYTLQICALRGDQACGDLFGRRIADGRLLM